MSFNLMQRVLTVSHEPSALPIIPENEEWCRVWLIWLVWLVCDEPAPSTPPPTEIVTPLPPTACPDPSIKLGAISASASLLDPPYPLVVGQDPDKRGVDVSFSASVSPTIYTYYTQEPIEECVPGTTASGQYNCTKKGVRGHSEQTGFQCVSHTQSYSECITSASASISLSKESRNWILNELSIRYPEAYLH